VTRLLFLALLHLAATAAQARPNIVFVILDDVGTDRVGVYSRETAGPTPQLDALAAEGVRLTRFWGTPNCSPFRASALTGLPVREHFVAGPIDPSNPRRARGLDPTLDTLPKRLRPLGYRSEAVGKWHLAGEPDFTPRHPLLAGFDRHAGTLGNPGSYTRFEKCIDGACSIVEDRYLTSDTTDDAIAALSGSEPFFVWVGYNAAHKPLHTPPAPLHSFGAIPCPDWDHAVCHQALVESLDSELGRLFAAIDWHDTTVVVAGDNGTPNTSLDAETPTAGKGSVYEAGLRVPLIVRGAAVAPAAIGATASGLAQATDLFATLLELAGISVETAHARSFAHWLSDPGAPSRRPWQYVERYSPNGPTPDPSRRHHRVAATDRYKLVLRLPLPTGVPELYDRFEHGDRVDLYPPGDDPARSEAFALLSDVIARHGAIPAAGAATPLPPALRSWALPLLVAGGALALLGIAARIAQR
jgi:arylsulfatase A-like enzyme